MIHITSTEIKTITDTIREHLSGIPAVQRIDIDISVAIKVNTYVTRDAETYPIYDAEMKAYDQLRQLVDSKELEDGSYRLYIDFRVIEE